MNHEIDAGAGGVSRHGQRGAYVSTFTIDRVSLEVKEGLDTIDPGVRYWNYVTREYQDEGVAGRAATCTAGAATSFRRRATRWCTCVRAR